MSCRTNKLRSWRNEASVKFQANSSLFSLYRQDIPCTVAGLFRTKYAPANPDLDSSVSSLFGVLMDLCEFDIWKDISDAGLDSFRSVWIVRGFLARRDVVGNAAFFGWFAYRPRLGMVVLSTLPSPFKLSTIGR